MRKKDTSELEPSDKDRKLRELTELQLLDSVQLWSNSNYFLPALDILGVLHLHEDDNQRVSLGQNNWEK